MSQIYDYEGVSPAIGNDVFIAPSSVVIGDTTLGDNSSVWFNVVIRGDVGPIRIGENTNIQDLSMLHITEEIPLTIGKNVTIGHSVTLHSCTIEDSCLIGMGATVLDHVVVGENSLVAANSLLPPGKKYPPRSLIRGNPGVVVRELSERELEQYGNHYKSYIDTKNRYLAQSQFNHPRQG